MHAWPVQVTSAPQLSCLSRLTQLDFDLLWLDRQVKQNLLHMLCQLACGAGCLASRSCYSRRRLVAPPAATAAASVSACLLCCVLPPQVVGGRSAIVEALGRRLRQLRSLRLRSLHQTSESALVELSGGCWLVASP
jgi:hypothetical protein